jgi:hypothetical protein
MGDKLGWMGKEAVVAYFKLPSQNFPGGTGESHGTLD